MQLTLTRTPEPEIAQMDPVQIDAVQLPIALAGTEPAPAMDIVEEWGMGSFPASDPPANW